MCVCVCVCVCVFTCVSVFVQPSVDELSVYGQVSLVDIILK